MAACCRAALSLKQWLHRNNFAAALDSGKAITGLHSKLAGQEGRLQGPGGAIVDPHTDLVGQ